MKKPFNKKYAWWFLSKIQKRQLQEFRMGGEYGGAGSVADGKAPYFWAQTGDTTAGVTAAHEANITPTGLTHEAEAVFNADWPRILDGILRL